MPKPLARWLVALAGAALLGGLLPGAATATRPSTQAEIDGVLAAVQRSPLLAKIPGRPFIVTQITLSTASTSPLYASGVVSPRKVAGRRRPAIDLLFRQNADGTWALLDFGDNFCGDAQVPGPVLQDLFGTSCGGSGGGVIALAAVGQGPQYFTATMRKSAQAYGTQSYSFASGVLLPARGTLPGSS